MLTKKSHGVFRLSFFIFLMTLLLVGCSSGEEVIPPEDQETYLTSSETEDLEVMIQQESDSEALDLLKDIENTPEEITSKNENIEGKKKLLVRKGDYYTFKQDKKAALRAYELAWKLSKKRDTSISAKMATLLFEEKMFERSVEHFENAGVPRLPTKDKIHYIRALQYTKDPDLKEKLQQLQLTDYLYEYFLISETCIHEPIRCEESIRSYAYAYEPGRRLQEALDAYEGLGIQDPVYKEALLVGAFYANQDYKTIAAIGDRVLASRPDYLPVLKVTGYAHYEMRDYERALELLERYKQEESKDPQIDYIMGRIYSEKSDYVTSNLYLNNAVLGGFEPKELAERKLAYNYYLLGLEKNMFQVLHYVLMGENAQEEDFTNAIYLAIDEGDLRKASMWIERGRLLHPDSAHILALAGWHLRISGDAIGAKYALEEAIQKDRKNALAYLQLGILAFEQDDFKEAHTNFSRASILDPKGIFGSQVDTYLTQMVEKERQQESIAQDSPDTQ